MNTIQARIAENIRRYGLHVMGVMPAPQEGKPGFAYTIGNALAGLPELLLIGNLAMEASASILNELSKRMADTKAPLRETESLGGQFPVRTRFCSSAAHDEWTIQAAVYLGHNEFQVMQVILCDPEGRYPGDAAIQSQYDVPLP